MDILKGILLIFLLCSLTRAARAVPSSEGLVRNWEQAEDEYSLQWKEFKQRYGKLYGEREEEEERRRKIFERNVRLINEHNEKFLKGLSDVTFHMAINRFTDMTDSEYKEFSSCLLRSGQRVTEASHSGVTYLSPSLPLSLPVTVDWRDQGYVTPVKDQGHCGSCWAFSSTGSLEGQLKRKTGKLVSLSEQNLVDCSLVWGNNGCQGGLMDNAFEYIKDNYGIDTEATYPYIGKDGTCHYNASESAGRDVGYVDLPEGSESKLKEAVATIGPISVGIDASQPSFRFYKGGIYNELTCTHTIDHAVLAVGYGTQGMNDYWIVKNSWGADWGDKGYILMSRNKENQCGIASMCSYPLV